MRGWRKALLITGGVGALLATGVGSIPATQATTSPINALQQKRAALVAELAAMAPALNLSRSQLGDAEAAYNAAQQKVLDEQSQLASLNAQMLTLNQQIAGDEAEIAKAKTNLAAFMRATYEASNSDAVMAAVLSAESFGQAMDRLSNASHVAQDVADLQHEIATKDAAVLRERAQAQRDFAQASETEAALGTDRDQLMTVLLARNQVFQSLNGPARAIAAQIAQIDEQIAAARSPRGGGGSCANHFAYGQCTWYVASRRCVPWGGNANQWYYNAARMGFPEGHTPVPGAIVVFWPGGDGASWIGHVAYVEAVGPAAGIPAGYFRLSEMNYAGWARVNYRVLPGNSRGIQGFIYNK
ncbi:MAG TPA: CHAP domain-containing protein [Candidatus Dormibacteraeota bacterium]|nr:CHAP domain-containing protein [Candidatus Dormibacteraeota bacterium]